MKSRMLSKIALKSFKHILSQTVSNRFLFPFCGHNVPATFLSLRHIPLEKVMKENLVLAREESHIWTSIFD